MTTGMLNPTTTILRDQQISAKSSDTTTILQWAGDLLSRFLPQPGPQSNTGGTVTVSGYRTQSNADTTINTVFLPETIVLTDVVLNTVFTSETIRLLEEKYSIRTPVEVENFIQSHMFLFPLLIDARPNIDTAFPGATVYLEIQKDPESSHNELLLAAIVVGLSPQEAFDQLEQFDESWWLENVDRSKGKLCINVEFE